MRCLVLLGVLALLLTFSCNSKDKTKESNAESLPATQLSGKELAHIHCGRCHAFVKPEMLPRTSWKNDVLPAMGNRLGIYNGKHQPDSIFGSPLSRPLIEKAGIFPEAPVLAKADWEKLVGYYLDNAGDTLVEPSANAPILQRLEHFVAREPKYANVPAFTTMVKIRSGHKGLVFSDSKPRGSTLTFLDTDLKKEHALPFRNALIDYREKGDTVYLTAVGRNIFPSNLSNGSVQKVSLDEKDIRKSSKITIISKMQRLADVVYGDLNGDGLEDVLACEFGDLVGKLTWFKNLGNNTYEQHILRESPGAVSAIIQDYDADGDNDVFVLMAQGDEGVFYYENMGKGTFSAKRILRFSPLNGSQYMELADLNADGLDDIVYVCGDNADKTPILKDYHGIYIFMNTGNLNFEQRFFYPLNGAYKAMARDFDLDGDLDLAAISYFPDYRDCPEESFVYLENMGGLKFQGRSFPQSQRGRWMVMDAGDIDADGDIDIALGSFVYFLAKGDTTGLSKRWLKESPSVLLLENTTRP
ncbi:MAG: FG-GAP-like repeat-containing protein [Bacteroidota bacterium]